MENNKNIIAYMTLSLQILLFIEWMLRVVQVAPSNKLLDTYVSWHDPYKHFSTYQIL